MAESKYLKKVQGNSSSTTLSSSISNVDTSAPLTSDSAFDGEGMVLIDEGTATEEFAYATGKVGSSLTILADDRGLEGGSAQSHASQSTVKGILTAGMWNNVITALSKVVSATTGALLKATGDTVNTGTSDDTIVTPKALADSDYAKTSDITVTADSTTTLTNKNLTSSTNSFADIVYTNSLSRQAIINGNFDVWQRGTSIAMTAANAYTADRWYCETATAGTDKTVSQQDGTGVNGSYYCARVAMVQDQDELLTFSQALESQDSIKFRGKKLTLSFYARGGAEFVADNSTLVSKIVTGKGTDQKVLAFTTSADAISQNNTLTTSWVKFTCTTTNVIASDITQIGVSFSFTHAGSGTTTNYFEVTQVQLCAGDVALPFMPKSFEEELRACMRYCYGINTDQTGSIVGFGYEVSTTIAGCYVYFPVEMRNVPAISPALTAGDWQIADGTVTKDCTEIILSTMACSKKSVLFVCTVADSLSVSRPCRLQGDGTANRILILSAEL